MLRAASGHPVVIEQKFLPGDTDFTPPLKIIQSSRADAIVLWTDEIPAAKILKQMRARNEAARLRLLPHIGPELLAEAGDAAEGFEAVFLTIRRATIQSGSTSTRGLKPASTKSPNSLPLSHTTRERAARLHLQSGSRIARAFTTPSPMSTHTTASQAT